MNIPAFNIPAGETIFGPQLTGAGLAGFQLSLDMSSLVNPCDIKCELDLNANGNWIILGEENLIPPFTDRKGNPDPIVTMGGDIGTTASGPILTNNKSLVRFRVNNTTAFHTSGGSLVVL